MDVNSQTPGAPTVASAADCCAACIADIQVDHDPSVTALLWQQQFVPQ